jgi:hypothetical protein
VQTLIVQDRVKAWLLDDVARKGGNTELQRRFNMDLLPALDRTAVKNVAEYDLWALKPGRRRTATREGRKDAGLP